MKKLLLFAAGFSLAACTNAPKPMGENHPPSVAPAPAAVDPRDPASINPSGDDDYKLETCGFKANAKYAITRGGDHLQGGQTNASGCVTTTFRDGRVRPGDNLVVEVEGKRVGETVPRGNGGGNTGGGGQNPGGGNQGGNGGGAPQPDPARSADLEKVRNQAENNARCMANAVVESYGKMERFRFNFHRGLRAGLATYNWQNLGSLRDTPEYRRGNQDGSAAGDGQGLAQGRSAGSSNGDSRGRSEARSRYAEVVDRGTPPNLDNTVPPAGFGGLPANISQPRSVEDRLRALDGDVQSWLRAQSFGYDGYVFDVWSDRWSPSVLYGWTSYQDTLVRSWYRDDWAFTLWRERRFSRCSQQVAYYDNIRDSSQTSNAQAAVSTFQSTFKRVYDNVIDEKWSREVSKDEPVAFNYGHDLGFNVAAGYARDVGYYNGYSVAFSSASMTGHGETYPEAYRAGFSTASGYYERNMVLDGLSAEIKPAGGGTTFGAGTGIDVTVKRLTNMGRQTGKAKVSLDGNVAGVTAKELPMEYSKSLKDAASFPAMGTIGFSGGANQSSAVIVRVDGLNAPFNVTVDWTTSVRNFLANASMRGQIQGFMKANLTREWETIRQGPWSGNLYKKPEIDTMLEQLVEMYGKMNADEKAAIRAIADDLKAAIGKKPGFLAWDDKAKWEAAGALYDKLK